MMRTLTWPIASLLLILCATSFAQAAPRATDLVQPQLLADTSAIEPGKPFRVGIRLLIQPNWHIYWRNPGDSGQATAVTFNLPEGFHASPLSYPVPTKFLQPGELVAYGYAGEVMLIATITPPDSLPSKVNLHATVKYLVCDENQCLPGKQELTLDLQGGANATPANGAVFAFWDQQIPVAGPSVSSIADVQTTGALTDKSGSYTVDITWKQPTDNIEFFPGHTSALNLHDIVVKNKGSHSQVTFTADLLAGQKPDVSSLDSVVVYTDPQGVRRGIDVSIPLNAQQK